MKVHFIAIGGSAMHNLAIALKRKGYEVSGSDDEIFEPSKGRLVKEGILPESFGWHPEKITNELDAIILGMHARKDNPELLKAQELGLNIYSYPEFVYNQTSDKKRLVIGGSHGKTTITSMILHVLSKLNINADYLVGAQLDGFDCMVRLTDAPLVVIEGDEYLSSPIDRRPKFHWYKPHVGCISGIAWDHINVFPTFENYLEQFKLYTDQFEKDGVLVYFERDKDIQKILPEVRKDIKLKSYTTPDYRVEDGVTYLMSEIGEIPLSVFGEHNLQNIMCAKTMLNEIGVDDDQFLEAIKTFGGAAKRLEKVAENEHSVAYKDFAHSPSKLKATVSAVKQQYPNRKLIACMELHTFSSLKKEFLPHYENCMAEADEALVYFSPEVVEHKRLEPITAEQVAAAFATPNVKVFTNSEEITQLLRDKEWDETNLLLMSSGNFHGVNLDEFAKELIN
ncbi:Mur ligase domain-containing protein [Paracrocinitomix mangrovi]|uniref:UDP-N-acetylmuramate--L-alanine ligase n=1 Tax=Paracrocinitomix mangrovi TaxID=2862509 RepID=UPI001C8DF293|nr:Mur ligase family protein [Paracrocinitomix mangrovi]UKN01653.1 Mur ligase domain-containing protein [Paracrocinitomix mangrovi]